MNATDWFHKAGYVKRSCHWIMQQKRARRHRLRRRNNILNNAFHTCRAPRERLAIAYLYSARCIRGGRNNPPFEIKSRVSVAPSLFCFALHSFSAALWRTQLKAGGAGRLALTISLRISGGGGGLVKPGVLFESFERIFSTMNAQFSGSATSAVWLSSCKWQGFSIDKGCFFNGKQF